MDDPKIIGPGIWTTIHLMALKCDTDSDVSGFISYINFLKTYFPCEICRKHMVEYIDKHPIGEYLNREEGLFKWSWMFHNNVNLRLGKSYLGWNQALKIYKVED